MVYYNEQFDGPGAIFSALGDETRLAIVMHLAGTDATINELAEPFGMSLQAVSKHVRVLEKAGIVRRRKIGRSYHCRLNTGSLTQAKGILSTIEAAWHTRLDKLGDYLDKEISN